MRGIENEQDKENANAVDCKDHISLGFPFIVILLVGPPPKKKDV